MNKRIKKKSLLNSIKSVKKMRLDKNDTIIVESKVLISIENRGRIHDFMKKHFPENDVIILSGLKFKIAENVVN